jgi:tetratricopeptide (TPR) repeat protein
MRLLLVSSLLLLSGCNHGLLQASNEPSDFRIVQPRAEWPATHDSAAADALLREGEKRVASQNTEDFQAALEREFEPAMRACSECPRARAWLAIAYIRLIEITPRDANTFAAIAKLVDPASLKGEVAEETVVARAQWLRLLGRNDEALTLLTQAIALRDTPELRYQQGAVYFTKNMPIEAAVKFAGLVNDPRARLGEKLLHAIPVDLDVKFPNFVPGRLTAAGEALDRKQPDVTLEILRGTRAMTPTEKKTALDLEARALAAKGDAADALNLMDSARDPSLDFLRHRLLSARVPAFTRVQAADVESQKSHWKEAEAELFAAALLAPDNTEISSLLGEAFLADHRYGEAENRFLKALAQSKGANGRAALGLARARIQLHEPNPAEFLQANSARTEWLLGMQARVIGAPAELSAAHFAKAQRIGTYDAEAFTEFGRAAEAAENLELAEFYYSLALRYEPFEIGALEGMASVRFALSSPTNAIAFLSDKLAQRPDSTGTEVALAMLYLRAGNQVQGKIHLQAAIRRNPKYARAFVELGRLTRAEGDLLQDYPSKRNSYRYSLASYEMASKLSPEDPEPVAQTAELYFSIRDLGAASRNYYRTAELAPWYPNVHLRLAQIARNGGDNKRAQELLREELRVNQYGEQPHVELGNILMTEKNFTAARLEFEEAVKVNPSNSDAWFGIGVAHHLEENYQAALTAFDRALVLNPLQADIYWQQGLIYQRQGRAAKAIQAFMNYKGIVKEPTSIHRADEKIHAIGGQWPVAEIAELSTPAETIASSVHARVNNLLKSGWMMPASGGRSIAGATRTFSNQFAEMQIPAGWECELQQQDWVCQPGNPAERGFAFLVVTAKIKRPGLDELPVYLSEQGKERFYQTMSGEAVTSKPRYTRMLEIEGHPWVEALQLGWETPDYYTRSYSTISHDLGVMVSFNVRSDYYSRYSAALTAFEKSLRVFRKSGDYNQVMANMPMPSKIVVSRTFEDLSESDRKQEAKMYGILEEAIADRDYMAAKHFANIVLSFVGHYRDAEFFEDLADRELAEGARNAYTAPSAELAGLMEQGNLLAKSASKVVYREALRNLMLRVQKLDAENPAAVAWSRRISEADKRDVSRLPASLKK